MVDFTPEKPQTLISIEAAINSPETRLVLQVLGRMGLSPAVVQSYEDLIRDNPEAVLQFPIDDITSREQFLGKEHFLSYRDHYTSDKTSQVAASAFYIATGQDAYMLYPSLTIYTRESAQLGPVPERYWSKDPKQIKRMAYAIQVDSFYRFAGNLDNDRLQNPYGVGSRVHTFVQGMSEFLKTKTDPQPAEMPPLPQQP